MQTNGNNKHFWAEVVLSVVFLLALVALKAMHAISDTTFTTSLVIWGLLTPTPYSWYLQIGSFLQAGRQRNGNATLQAKVYDGKVAKTEEEKGSEGKNF